MSERARNKVLHHNVTLSTNQRKKAHSAKWLRLALKTRSRQDKSPVEMYTMEYHRTRSMTVLAAFWYAMDV